MEHNATISNTGKNINVGLRFFKMVHYLLALIIVAWMSSGIFSFTLPYIPSIFRYGLFAIWFGFAILNKRFAKRFIHQCWPLIIFLFYILSLSIFISQSYLTTYSQGFLYLLMVYSIFLYYIDKKYAKFQKLIIGFLIFDFLFVSINTYLKLKENPNLSRYLSMGAERRNDFLGMETFIGIGDYRFFYGLVAIIILFSYTFLYRNKDKFKSLLLLLVFIPVLIKSNFTIAIIFSFSFILLLMIFKLTKKYRLIALLFIAILMLFSKNILIWFFNKVSNLEGLSLTLAMRIEELSHLLSGNLTNNSNLQVRFEIYLTSLKAFAHNFLTGTTLPININFLSVGGHSAWLDTLAYFGIISILFFVFLYKSYKFTINIIPKQYKVPYIICGLYFLILGLINTLFFSTIFIVWFLFIPIYLKLKESDNSTEAK